MPREPRLRTVEKYKPPFPLNQFPKDFPFRLGREIVYLLASRGHSRLEGPDWEEVFARLIGAKWKPSNVGLDDIVLRQTAWGAKSVKNRKPSSVAKVRLISGRNSIVYSYKEDLVRDSEPDELGPKILEIWNERVAAIRALYRHVRTVVLVKSEDLLELAVFEFETCLFPSDGYWWQWNERNNLEGFCKKTDEHVFTWQPHGSQFTIVEDVPKTRLAVKIRKPPILERDAVLKTIQFDNSWVEIL